MLNITVEERAFEELQHKKEGHSKVMNLEYSELKMQKYLKANEHDIN